MKYVLLCTILFLSACGPDWGDCLTCRPGESSVEGVDSDEQVPVIVNVTVINNNDQNQTQGQGQTQTQTQTTPPAPPPTCNSRKVCTTYAWTWKCTDGSYHGNKHSCGSRSCHQIKKCVKEEWQCK